MPEKEKTLSEGLDAFYATQYATPPAEQKAGSSLIRFKKLKSDALAVHPDQVPEFHADARKRGFNIDFTPGGRPIFESSRQFRQYAKSYGFRHKGYA